MTVSLKKLYNIGPNYLKFILTKNEKYTMDAQRQNSRKLQKKIVKQQKEKEKEEMNKEVQKQLENKE